MERQESVADAAQNTEIKGASCNWISKQRYGGISDSYSMMMQFDYRPRAYKDLINIYERKSGGMLADFFP